MRLSRKAGLLACNGVWWTKYECYWYPHFNGGYWYGHTHWKTVETGTNSDAYYQGSSSYCVEWNSNNKRYEYVPDGDVQSYTSPRYPGTVYDVGPVTLTKITVDQYGFYSIQTRELLTTKTYDDAYRVEGKIGTVRAAEGEYPDAKNGYTHVTIYDGYTIMKDSDGNYYAYALVDPSTEEDAEATISATIENDVLIVTGDGTATIENDVLIVDGNAGSAVSNNILYVR